MKAFVMTMDAMVAVSFMLTAMIMLSAMSLEPSAPRGAYMKEMTLDLLSVIEKSGTLGNLMDGNSTGIRSLLEATPDQVCMSVYIANSTGQTIAVIPKNGCGALGSEVQVASRHFVYYGQLYMLKAESWRKEGVG